MYEFLAPGGCVEFQDDVPEFSSYDGTSLGSGLERWGSRDYKGLSVLGVKGFEDYGV